MRSLLLTLSIASLVVAPAWAEDRPARIAEVTKGFSLHGHATGDLNGDNVADEAVLVEPKPAKGEGEALMLRVFFADKDGKLTLAALAPKAACYGCGGIKGGDEPYRLAIANGVLSLSFDGGSRQTRSLTTKWRFQNGEFALIGVAETLMDSIAGDNGAIVSIARDANLSTRKMVETVRRVTGITPGNGEIETKLESKRCKIGATFRAPKLKDLDYEAVPVPRCTNLELP